MKGIKNFTFKKAVAFMAAAAACLQLAACGGGGGGNTTAQKEFVYVPEYQQISGKIDGVENLTVIGDTIYYTGGEYEEASQIYTTYLCSLKAGEKEPVKVPLDFGTDSTISRMSADMDGNFQVVVFTYLYEDKEQAGEAAEDGNETEEEEAGQKSETPEKDAGVEKEEGNAKAEGENPEAPEEDTDTTAEGEDAAAEGETEEESGEAVSVRRTGGGSVVVSESAASSTAVIYGNDSEYREPVSQKTEIYKISPDGTVISTIDISGVIGEDAYVQYLETDKDGNIYIGYDQAVYVLDQAGKELFKLELDSWLNNMFSTKDGTVMVCYYGQERMEARPIDLTKKSVGEADKNLMVSDYGNYVFSKGSDTDVLFSVENSLYSYNFGDEAPLEILNWIDSDINTDDLRAFATLPDGRIVAVTSYWEGEKNTIEFIYLTKKKGSEVPEKKILTFGTMFLSYDMRKQIIDFNKTNQEYRIEVKQYVQNYSTEDYGTGLTQMNTDIVSGNGPDIIDLSGSSITQYGGMGVLEDLYPYIDKDEELNREDYLPNILKAFEVDGKLCAISPKFFINTIIAKVSDVGERKSITLDELMKIVDELPEGADLYQYSTKDTILMYNIMMNLDEYIDWTTGECKFNTGEFEKALEFSNKFESEFNYSDDQPGTATRLHDGSLIMLNASISSVQDYQMYEGMFGEPITFAGFPTNKEVGSFVSTSGNFVGMSSKSKYKEGAWQFIRMSLTKEAQEDTGKAGSWGLPIMKSALEAEFKEDMTEEYYEDGDGNKVKQSKTSWGYDDFKMEIYAATEEQVAAVRELIESVDTLYQYNEQINNIITEETAAFFEGQKKAKEVVDIVQNRVQIYVNENR